MPLRTFIGPDGKLAIKPRERNAAGHWSGDRDRNAQARFRAAVLARDHFTCQRCGRRDASGRTLDAHHLRPGYDADCGETVCNSQAPVNCHRALDLHAR